MVGASGCVAPAATEGVVDTAGCVPSAATTGLAAFTMADGKGKFDSTDLADITLPDVLCERLQPFITVHAHTLVLAHQTALAEEIVGMVIHNPPEVLVELTQDRLQLLDMIHQATRIVMRRGGVCWPPMLHGDVAGGANARLGARATVGNQRLGNEIYWLVDASPPP